MVEVGETEALIAERQRTDEPRKRARDEFVAKAQKVLDVKP